MRRRTLSIQEDNLNLWTRNHQYQLSSSLDPTPKNQAIPGYGGFIPQLKAGNLHGRGYSPLTRVAFQIKIPKLDPPACSTSKYGQSTIQTILPQCSTSISAQSSYMDIYQDPKKQINPTYRKTKYISRLMDSGYKRNNESENVQIQELVFKTTEYRQQFFQKPFRQ